MLNTIELFEDLQQGHVFRNHTIGADKLPQFISYVPATIIDNTVLELFM